MSWWSSNPRLPRPLSHWLTLRFVGVALLPPILVATFVWLVLLPKLQTDIEVRHRLLARAVAGQVQTYLVGAKQQLASVVQYIRDRDYQPPEDWFGVLDAQVGAGDVFEAIYIVNAADRVYSVGLPEMRHPQRQDLLGLDLSQRFFLREARLSNGTVWSETFLSAVSGRLSVALTMPVAGTGQVVIGEIATEPLVEFLQQLPRESAMLTAVLDSRGQVIAQSQLDDNGQQINLSHLSIVQDALRGDFKTEPFLLEGKKLFGTLESIPKIGWTVLVAQPQRAAFLQISFIWSALAGGLIAALLLAVATGWLLARGFAERIGRYTEKAHAIAIGDYEQSWPDSDIQEFAQLATDLQHMLQAILERKQALADSEARFRDLSAMASDWFWEQDEQLRFTFFSSGVAGYLAEKLGKNPTSMIGKTRWELPVDLTSEEWAAHRAHLEARQPFRDLEYRVNLEGSEERWFSINGQPLFDANGKFIGYRGTGRDITERKRAEQRQRQAAAVFDATREAILVTDTRWRIVAVNPAFTSLTDYQEAEVLGRKIPLLLADEQPGFDYATLRRTLNRTGAWQGELRGLRRSGKTYITLVTLNPVCDDANRLTQYVAIATDITEQKESEQRIKHLAYYDSLTQLPNRTLLYQRSEMAIALADRRGVELAVLFLDLDRFKEVNDGLGHAEGDALLILVAKRLSELTRASDTVCRLGGDEFVVLLPETCAENARRVADKISTAFRQPFIVAGHNLRVTTSLGIAIYPHDGENFQTLLKNADAALYQAKRDGRNNWAFYDKAMNMATFKHLLLETQLREAIENDQLCVYFQPKVRLTDSLPVGAEALVRWQHPEHGMIPPGHFIPVAEASDLIVELDDWVLNAVCNQLLAWRKQGLPIITVAVNLTARHFRRPGFSERLQKLLAAYNLPAQALELEITESTLVGVNNVATETLSALQQMGVSLAIDDFGTGYSSLSYLKRMPISVLKIDQSFVRDLETDLEDRVLAATIVSLGHSLDLQVVAEGVETVEQQRILVEQGCDLAQGYLFGRPVPAEDFLAELEKIAEDQAQCQ